MQAKIVTLDATGEVILTPVLPGVVYMAGWRWLMWNGQLGFSYQINRKGEPQDFVALNTDGLLIEQDAESGKVFMILSHPSSVEGPEPMHIPAQKQQFQISREEGPAVRYWYTASIGDIQLLGAESFLVLDPEYVAREEAALEMFAQLIAEEAALNERMVQSQIAAEAARAAEEIGRREEQRRIQVAVVSIDPIDLVPFVRCWPHLHSRKPHVNRMEMERVIRRWARKANFNLMKAVYAAEPYFAKWRLLILANEPAKVPPMQGAEEMLTMPPAGDVAPVQPEEAPVVAEEPTQRFRAPLPTAVFPTPVHTVEKPIRFEALAVALLDPSWQCMLGIKDQTGALQLLAQLRANDGKVPDSIAEQLGDNIYLLEDLIDEHRLQVNT